MVVKFPKQPKLFVKGRHRLKRAPHRITECWHNHILIDPYARQVSCGDCQVVLDPIDALMTLTRKTWWELEMAEGKLEYEEKRVQKVQYAAVKALFEMGMTPEKYADRWEKERALRLVGVPVAKAENKDAPLQGVLGGNNDAA